MAELSALRVLFVEDNTDDLAAMLHAIEEWGRQHDRWTMVVSQVVSTEEELKKTLLSGEIFDVIIAEYTLPLSAATAYDFLQSEGNRTPFIIVSSVANDTAYLELLARGAADYLRKDRIVRLGASVERVVEHYRLLLRTERGLSLGGQITGWLKDISGRLKHILPGHEKEMEDEISQRLDEIIEKIDQHGKIGWKTRG